MRDSGLISTAPNAAKSTTGTLGSDEAGAAAGGAAQNPFDVGLHVVLGDAALDAGSLDPAQIGAQLAREFAHRWAGVGLGEGLLVDRWHRARAAPRGAAARPRGRRGLGRCGGRGRVRQPAPLQARPWRRPAGGGRARARQQRPRPRAGSSNRISEPSETLSPCLSLTCVIRPATGAGTSIAAFSVSIVISGVSLSIC